MFLAGCRERDDEKMYGKVGDCFKTANVESCMMLTYVKDFIPNTRISHSMHCIIALILVC